MGTNKIPAHNDNQSRQRRANSHKRATGLGKQPDQADSAAKELAHDLQTQRLSDYTDDRDTSDGQLISS